MREETENGVMMPMIPLRGIVMFPNTVTHLDIGRKRSINAVNTAMKDDSRVFLAAQKDMDVEDPGRDEIYATGVVAVVKQLLKMPGGTIRILVEGEYRAKIREYNEGEDCIWVKAEEIEEWPVIPSDEIEAMRRVLIRQFENYAHMGKKIPEEQLATITALEDNGRLVDTMVSHMSISLEEKQKILEEFNADARMRRLLQLLSREKQLMELERRISNQTRQEIDKSQKEYYLREQMKVIQKELGDTEDAQTEMDEYREKIKAAHMPDYAEAKALKEMEKIGKMSSMTPEMAVVRSYLDWMVELPWDKETEDRIDLKEAERILERDHFGLEKPKERILEFLAIRKLATHMKAPIICFVGPPGTGKTSLAHSIAEALGRKFVRMSLGGVHDEAEIRGHRRTYVASMPGRILERMKEAGTKNPVFLMDEIDKMASDFRGDPASAMLEVLDPEQNVKFSDHYLEVPFDLSHVLFIMTANSRDTIPGPLLDRMEIIEVTSYTEEEKVQIALRHLVDKELKEHGLNEENIRFSEGAVRKIIENYTRESGVRSLERNIAAVCRKVARKVVDDADYKVNITKTNLGSYLGVERFHYDEAEKEGQIGVTTGLAWTSVGGEILTIEATAIPGKGNLVLTGQLGDVMKESAQAALTVVKSRAEELSIDYKTFSEKDIHVHVPEGAIPKDGPSAGITMATTMASVFTKRKVRSDIAMTGEITLRGRVLPIGGLKEKSLAAYRSGIHTIIIPEENRKDLEEIPENIRKKIDFFPVKRIDQVFDLAFEK